MTHHSRLFKIVIDVPAASLDSELAFWQAASGLPLPPNPRFPEYYGSGLLHGQEFALLVQRLGDGLPRVHIDIHTDDLEAEVTRLEGLGAERVKLIHYWWVMRDPAGLLFCVLPDRSGELTDANSHRWD
ncbi:MAG TPA: VOC family protein [Streptosporangiaceae bacterium]